MEEFGANATISDIQAAKQKLRKQYEADLKSGKVKRVQTLKPTTKGIKIHDNVDSQSSITYYRRTTTDARDKGKGKLIEVPSTDKRSTSVRAHVDQFLAKYSTSDTIKLKSQFKL